jgi:membrane-associated phospholipid phosphatase
VRKSSAPTALEELRRLDAAVYTAIAKTDTPTLDCIFRGLSRSADYSKLSIASAAALAVGAGPDGRRAAFRGMAAVAATAAIVNVVMKPLSRRARPDREGKSVPLGRRVRMPASHSFPSGHTAAAFAFATGAGRSLPWTAPPLSVLATLVGYSRVHTGVHYPLDVIVGALSGVAIATLSDRALDFVSVGDPERPLGGGR